MATNENAPGRGPTGRENDHQQVSVASPGATSGLFELELLADLERRAKRTYGADEAAAQRWVRARLEARRRRP
jgi:hypothetical protein